MRTDRSIATGAPNAGRLAAVIGALVGLDVVGGLVAIRDGINEPREAWGSAAFGTGGSPVVTGRCRRC